MHAKKMFEKKSPDENQFKLLTRAKGGRVGEGAENKRAL